MLTRKVPSIGHRGHGVLNSRYLATKRHEHLEILDAILARDSDRAGEAMRRHLDNVREAILTHIHRLY